MTNETDKRLLPPAYLGMALLAMVALHLVAPVASIPTFDVRLAGLAPLAAGIALNLAADRAFKKRGTTVKPFERSTALVTAGVLTLSRNPMYLGMVLILLGVALLLGSAAPFAVVALFALALDRRFIRVEERMLADAFGDDWRAYRRRVRRWL